MVTEVSLPSKSYIVQKDMPESSVSQAGSTEPLGSTEPGKRFREK
jgi:hypothetical protein